MSVSYTHKLLCIIKPLIVIQLFPRILKCEIRNFGSSILNILTINKINNIYLDPILIDISL